MTIKLDNLSAGYDRHPAVHHVTGEFQDASLTAIIGPNGGGKSTLLKVLMGFVPAMTGAMIHDDILPAEFAYLPQTSEVDRQFPINVLDVVCLGGWRETSAFGGITAAMRDKAYAALDQVGMKNFAGYPIRALSTGQWQRVLFARLSLQNAHVLLLDEPFAAIDDRTTHDLIHILQQWNQEGRTVIVVMHDLDLVRDHFPYALMLARELIAWGNTHDVLQDTHLAQAQMRANGWTLSDAECQRTGA